MCHGENSDYWVSCKINVRIVSFSAMLQDAEVDLLLGTFEFHMVLYIQVQSFVDCSFN